MLLDPESEAAAWRAREIGESPETFRASGQLAVARLRELADEVAARDRVALVECYLYETLPTWRVIALDEVLFVSAFTADAEGHRSPMYKIVNTPGRGALYPGFRRHLDEVRRTSRRVV